MSKKVIVSFVIVHYKVKKELLDLIGSIYKVKSKTAFEIIVVDNSRDNGLEKELRKKYSKVKYLAPSKNLGFGAGNNLGAEVSKGNFLFFLNPDTLFKNNAIDTLYSFLKSKKEAGVVSPLLLKEDDSPYLQGSKELNPRNAIFSISFIHKFFPNNSIAQKFWLKDWNKKDTKEVNVAPGTAFMISKELFERVGKFDERFFLYFEENDLCNRVRKAGYKIFILPKAKVYHRLGVSTSQNPRANAHFKKSRFLYFKKHYGLTKAIPTELLIRFNKEVFIFLLIMFIAAFLRFYRLPEIMEFIGDQGWYYLSARDMILTREIPLVGITSSHIWLHQGAFWTYILALIFKLFAFNPVVPAYFTASLDIVTLIIVYLIAKTLFSQKIAFLSALFYATSPGIIFDVRMPYHTSPIPFFTAILLFAVSKWTGGNLLFFPVIVLILSILYNFEIATFSLSGIVILLFIYGFWKKKEWARGIFNKKIVALSGISFFIPLIPFLLYDIGHGFPQTVKFVVWLFYKISVFAGFPPINPAVSGETWLTWYGFITILIRKLLFYPNVSIALIILAISFSFLGYRVVHGFRKKDNGCSYLLVFIAFFIPSLAYISAKTNSAAYLLIFYPQLAIMIGILFGSFNNKKLYLSLVFFTILIFVNSHGIFSELHNRNASFLDKISASREIIRQSKDRPYNIVGTGPGSNFESHTMGYQYLTWWLGNGQSEKQEKLKFNVYEYPDRIVVREK